MNALPQLEIQFLHENGVSLLQDPSPKRRDNVPEHKASNLPSGANRTPDSQENDRSGPEDLPTPEESRPAEGTDVSKPQIASMCVSYAQHISRMALPEFCKQSPFTDSATLLFEPDPG
jgi:hypothetical protein